MMKSIMKISSILASSLLFLGAYGQSSTAYNDPFTGITFQGYIDEFGFRCGYVLPKNASTDFVGQIVSLRAAFAEAVRFLIIRRLYR